MGGWRHPGIFHPEQKFPQHVDNYDVKVVKQGLTAVRFVKGHPAHDGQVSRVYFNS